MIYSELQEAKERGQKKFAVLIDPDKIEPQSLHKTIALALQAKVDYFFIGGSLVVDDQLDFCVQTIKKDCNIPTILFPGSTFQISFNADAILFLSLISGRNPELLIGKHVITAPYLHKSSLEVLSTGYMLVDGGVPTTVSYISGTHPIPSNKPDIAVCTAMAGEMLGMKLLYLDAGSGAQQPVTNKMVEAVSQNTNVPLILGGGIRTPQTAYEKARAGADVIVVGNALEKSPNLVIELASAIHAAGDSNRKTSSFELNTNEH